ncbi:MAG: RNA-binding protein [Verrucomicrobiota bacterium]|nr:RNA-binding protein [Verrucomicrobiota bacterium]
MQLSTRELIIYAVSLSAVWFALGIVIGCVLSGMRAARSSRGKGPSRRAGDAGDKSDLVELYVGNLSYDVSEKELFKTFKAYGSVASARVISNRFTGKSRGFGFVEMDNREEAETAIRAMNGKDICGRKIVVNEAK